VIDLVRATEVNPVLVDVGDVAGDPVDELGVEPELVRRVRAAIGYDALAAIGYDLMVPGERDLTLGLPAVTEAVEAAGADLLATNVWLAGVGAPAGETIRWIETGHGDVAILAVVNPLDDGEHLATARGHGQGVDVLDAAEALNLAMPGVLERAAFVVLLAHGSLDWARGLLEEVQGIDLCVASHDEPDPMATEMIGQAMLVRTGANDEFLGRVRLFLDADGTITFGFTIIPIVKADYEERPDVLELVDGFADRANEAQAQLDGANPRAPHPSGADYRGFSTCTGCHPEQANAWFQSRHVEAFHALQEIGFHVEPECFECHTTGFGYATGFVSREATPGLANVGCEACHGPTPEVGPCPAGYGDVQESTCRACHRDDRSPDFDFETWSALIGH
jgi:hypothetical protein